MLSKSVYHALEAQGFPNTKSTRKFIFMFNRFFDCLNVRSIFDGQKSRNDDLKPYESPTDIRLKVCELIFLLKVCVGYL